MFANPTSLNNNEIEKVDNYEDDFEPDSTSEEVPKTDTSTIKKNEGENDKDDDNRESTTNFEKGQSEKNGDMNDEHKRPEHASSPTSLDKEKEVESPGRDKSSEEVSDNEFEMDADAYNFTEDQKRAMMELLVQKQEDSDDLLVEDPPEYNVKGRLEQLNAELASEPTPVEGDRELKVGFKSEIVDLVAPPPNFSDDESQPNSARGEPQAPGAEPRSEIASHDSKSGQDESDNESKESKSNEKGDKQFVVEREGNFEVLSADELTASERAMLMPESDGEKNSDKEQKNSETPPEDDNDGGKDKVVPKPPARPRPNTANAGTRRNVRPAQSPRPKSASHTSGSVLSLSNFSYTSPYAMTPEQKEHGREHARKAEEERKEKEKRTQEEAEQRHKENERSFQAWLKQKRDENKKRQDGDEGKQQSEQERSEQDEILKMSGVVGQSEAAFKTYDIIYPYLLKLKDAREENEEAYKAWLKEKRTQGQKEKLLKRRQQQEMMEAYYVRPREECDKAFKEWLRKKNVDLRRQHEMERQRNKLYRIQVKRSKKTQALLKAMKESQAFRYVDYYGYRF